ncbi:hypothetical protein LTR56_023915 [Elasticomyces elasticus]|nr:hypothetical protein LTR56_023915 [Elasticomyces elasticus]
MATNPSAFVDCRDQPLRVAKSSVPKPSQDDITLRTLAVAVDTIDPAQGAGFQIKQHPAIVGVDLAGDVYEIGINVSRFKRNDHVIRQAWQLMTGLPEDGAFSLCSAEFRQQTLLFCPRKSATPRVLCFL